MTRKERKVIKECIEATRTHEKTVGEVVWNFPQLGHMGKDVTEGLAITATKLEKLLEGEK